MVVQPNRTRYLLSIAEELRVQSKRVRDLIGDRHWYSDGHQKEFLILELLKRHLPCGMIASRGFVISPSDPNARSREQDILIVDTLQQAPIFNQGNVVIVFPSTVRATISVKTKMGYAEIVDSVRGLNSVRRIFDGHLDPRRLWCGAYYFEPGKKIIPDPLLTFKYLQNALADSPLIKTIPPPIHPAPLGPDLHCTATDLAFRLDHGHNSGGETVVQPSLYGYSCNGLATALFIGELLDHVAVSRGATDSDFSHFADTGDIRLLDNQTRMVEKLKKTLKGKRRLSDRRKKTE